VCSAALFEDVGVRYNNVVHGPKHVCGIVCANLSHESRTNRIYKLLQFRGYICLCFLVPNCIDGAQENFTHKTR
jgi:hypothetical protein